MEGVSKEDPREILTYSTLRMFRDCRKEYFWRNIAQLVPSTGPAHALSFGRLVHAGLRLWHETRSLETVLEWLDLECAMRATDEIVKRDWHYARAMLVAYAARYQTEAFEIISLEDTFRAEIRNPETGATSRTFILAGKFDGLVRNAHGIWILEHKTASTINAGYLERLWTDFQVAIYARKVEEVLGIHIEGVIYNVLLKPRLEQAKGETEEEFRIRYAELCAKNKSGKSSAQRQLPESDKVYATRLGERLALPEAFHREQLITDDRRLNEIESELWELTQQLLVCRRTGKWYQNTSQCFHYNRACPYWQLCRSGGSDLVREQFYRLEPPHAELREDEPEVMSGKEPA